METLGNLGYGFSIALGWQTLAFCLAGVAFGTLVGALPGISALAALSILLPLTYYIDPTPALVMMAGIYYGSQYGNSISAILLNLPGTPAAAVTCIDGYPMAQKGRGGVALCLAALGSLTGGIAAVMLLVMFAPYLARVAVAFGSPEYFSIMLLGLVAASVISEGSPVRGIAMVVIGLLLGIVGMDVQTGVYRFTFGTMELFDGISLVALAMGLLGISEVISQTGDRSRVDGSRNAIAWHSLIPSRQDFRQAIPSALRGSAIGSGFGTLPGTGASVASFFSYAMEKRISRTPEAFGKGAVQGVVGPESANSSAAQASFIPTLTLGIPGDAVVALLLGAMIIHGIQPGPNLIVDNPEIFWGLLASFFIGNLFLVVLNIPLIGLWVRILTIPYSTLYPTVLVFACLGVYSVRNNPFDILVLLAAAIAGYIASLGRLPLAPLILGFILGPLLESNMRRSLLMSGGDLSIFMTRPISGTFLVLTACILIVVTYLDARARYRSAA